MRLLLVALFVELGLVLAIVPWSVYWDRNYFVESIPFLHGMLTNNFVRGAVSGLGVVNLVMAAVEMFSIIVARRAARDPIVSIGRSSFLEDK
jgi:hypothetical protein